MNVLISGAIVLTCMSCRVQQERREVHTLANLQALASRLSGLEKAGAIVSNEDFSSVVHEYFEDGKDPWGNPIVFIPAPETSNLDFLLISTGSDNILDVVDAYSYFEIDQHAGDPNRPGTDIVLRGIKTVKYGAHK